MITREKAYALRRLIELAAQYLEDKDALEGVELFPKWEIGKQYEIDEKIKYNGTLYKVLQSHTSIESWTPDAAVSLFAQVLIPDEDEIYDWVQPDSTNPYMRGDKVRHNNKIWESDIDNNVWEPGAIGTESLWHEVIE